MLASHINKNMDKSKSKGLKEAQLEGVGQKSKH